MTTKNSSVARLRAQAQAIAAKLKAFERGEAAGFDPTGKLVAARARGEFVFGIVMDDKLLKITMPWSQIRETDERGLVEWILARMREENPAA